MTIANVRMAAVPWRIPAMLLLGLLSLAFFAACGGGEESPAQEGEINVFAASSLTESFEALGEAFEAANPGVDVSFNFAASSALATQIREGAPADVFASADMANMTAVVDAGAAADPQVFARNSPVVVVPADNTSVMSFEDLAKPGLRLVLAGPSVPIGRYAREVLTNASTADGGISADFSERVLANLRSEEANVRAVLTKVQLGEADAGIVYVTDIGAAASDVRQVEIPGDYNVLAEYPIATISDSDATEIADAFVAFVLSDEGQAVLASFGFQAP